jgi:hypothetical protein
MLKNLNQLYLEKLIMKLTKIQPKEIIDRPIVKFIAMPAAILILLLSLAIGNVKSQYDLQTTNINAPQETHKSINLCIGVLDCAPKQSPTINQGSGDIVLPLNDDTNLRVKPSAAAIAATATTTVTIAVLTALGIVALPAEVVLLSGALIGAGTYLVLKSF